MVWIPIRSEESKKSFSESAALILTRNASMSTGRWCGVWLGAMIFSATSFWPGILKVLIWCYLAAPSLGDLRDECSSRVAHFLL
jgi:hypothetical protein